MWNQIGRKLKVFHSYDGCKYVCNEMEARMAKWKIMQRLKIPELLQQNGIATRLDRTLLYVISINTLSEEGRKKTLCWSFEGFWALWAE